MPNMCLILKIDPIRYVKGKKAILALTFLFSHPKFKIAFAHSVFQ